MLPISPAVPDLSCAPRRRHRGPEVLLAALLGLLAAAAVPASPSPRLILVSWDAGGDVLLDRLLAEQRLPHLARLAAAGARAEHVVGTVPTKTAPSHASIYTGCGPGAHGVASNSVVHARDPADHTALERYRGFSSTALLAEPIFASTVRQGWDTVILAASHYAPHDDLLPWLPEKPDPDAGTFRSFSSFELPVASSRAWSEDALGPPMGAEAARAAGWSNLPRHRGPVRELALEPGRRGKEERVYALAFDSPEDPIAGFDRMLLRVGSRESGAPQAVLAPSPADSEAPRRHWSPALELRRTDGAEAAASTFFRLFELDPDGSRLLLYRRKASAPSGSHSAADLAALEEAWPGSFDEVFRPYLRGLLGKPLPVGGDGRAEERLLEIAAFESDLLIAGSRLAWETWRPRALFPYTPLPAPAAHTWMAALDPESPLYSADTSPALWDVYARLMAQLDRWLGVLLELGGDDTVVALVSDHGMAWTDRDFFPNRALEQAGLLHRTAGGEVDLERSDAFAAELDFAVRVNDRRWKGGRVAPEDRRAVIERAAEALLAARDPSTGKSLVRRVFTAAELGPHHTHAPGDPAALHSIDLFFDPAPGVYPVGGLSEVLVRPVPFPWGKGTHGHWPERRDMHAVFYLAGPGVRRGVEVPPVRQIDIAPTLAAVLGLEPPRQACGRVSHEVLARP